MNKRPLQYTSLILCIILFIVFNPLFLSRYHYQQGLSNLEAENYRKALAGFKKALLPIGLADDFRVRAGLGEAYFKMATEAWQNNRSFSAYLWFLKLSRRELKMAVEAAPRDYRSAYWLARAEAGLERLYSTEISGSKTPYNAAPLFEQAMALRPHGIAIRFYYAAYLHQCGPTGRIGGLVKDMAHFYPPIFPQIRSASFFSEAYYPHAIEGLSAAATDNIETTESLAMLTEIAQVTGNIEQAIQYGRRKLGSPSGKTFEDYLQMGELCLSAGTAKDSFPFFNKALRISGNLRADIRQIYRLFADHQQYEAFIFWAESMKADFQRFSDIDICVAKALIELNQLAEARQRLLQMITEAENPLAYFLLAKIAQQQENWGEMELAIQKATALDEDNRAFLLLFIESLMQQKKYAQAEAVATRLITVDGQTDPYGYNKRAWSRRMQNKDQAAIDDWQKAAALSAGHDKAVYFFWISRAYHRMGFRHTAISHIDKALEISPTDKSFIEWKQTIEH